MATWLFSRSKPVYLAFSPAPPSAFDHIVFMRHGRRISCSSAATQPPSPAKATPARLDVPF